MHTVDEYTLPGIVLAMVVTFFAVYGMQALVHALGSLP